ncbi:hypothetical protein BDV93DRAFT_527782 [Ceratobasidium sp. AG-I]|nr:hypothetical protein BDV93DRAFT_527782 [Ceratobasidium sp. AG-I]
MCCFYNHSLCARRELHRLGEPRLIRMVALWIQNGFLLVTYFHVRAALIDSRSSSLSVMHFATVVASRIVHRASYTAVLHLAPASRALMLSANLYLNASCLWVCDRQLRMILDITYD